MQCDSMEYPLASAEKLLKRANMRVGDDAVKEFCQLLEEITADIASEAAANAQRAKRKTVTAEDIAVAKRRIL
jgi:histone H3/H4